MNNFKKLCLLALCIICFCDADAQTKVTYYTSMGNFDIVLTDTLTPITVDSFKVRVSQKFYDGLIFHRVIDGFMIQGGDPLGNGTGGPGYTTPDEYSPTLKNVPGALAMANSGPNTDGCQFYINLVNNASLNNHYTVFGMVTANFTVVQSIGHVTTDANNKPLTNVVIDSIRIDHPPAAAVNNIATGFAAHIYPNPSDGIFNIDLPGIQNKVEIVNMVSAIVYQTEGTGTLTIDLSGKPTGLYIVRVTNVNGVYEHKVIIR